MVENQDLRQMATEHARTHEVQLVTQGLLMIASSFAIELLQRNWITQSTVRKVTAEWTNLLPLNSEGIDLYIILASRPFADKMHVLKQAIYMVDLGYELNYSRVELTNAFEMLDAQSRLFVISLYEAVLGKANLKRLGVSSMELPYFLNTKKLFQRLSQNSNLNLYPFAIEETCHMMSSLKKMGQWFAQNIWFEEMMCRIMVILDINCWKLNSCRRHYTNYSLINIGTCIN